MSNRKNWIWIGIALILVLGALFAVPAVNRAFFARADQLRLRLIYLIKPPENQVFTPGEQQQVSDIVQATLTAMIPTASLTPTPQATPTETLAPDIPTATALPPTPTSTPLPASALIPDVPYVDQNYGQNNCAPANITMALKFWGWDGTREQVSKVVKPFERDKNVMPYELVDYVNTQTNLRALTRVGGTPELLKTLIASGFPVIVERGVYLRDLTGRELVDGPLSGRIWLR